VKEHANKEIRVRDVFAEGEQVDITAVTKGKGFQGTVKRFHVKIRQHKSEKVKRGIGSLGAWHPKRVLFTVPQSGKMGFHTRSDRNKWILKISDENINPNGGFNHYGLIKNEYIMLKGSVPGPCKRLIRLVKSRNPMRSTPKDAPIIESVIVR
jgi:large subunit ribosomal protein L3